MYEENRYRDCLERTERNHELVMGQLPPFIKCHSHEACPRESGEWKSRHTIA